MAKKKYDPTEIHYSMPLMNRVFIGSGLLLLVLSIASIWYDWRGFRDWKEYQWTFRQWEREKAGERLEQLRGELDTQQLEELRRRQEEARKGLKEHREELLELDAKLRELEPKADQTEQNLKFTRSEIDPLKYNYEEALHKGHEKETQKWKERLEAKRERARELEVKLEELRLQQEDLLAAKGAIMADIREARAQEDLLTREVKAAERALAELEESPIRMIRDAPLMDFIGPTTEIKQVVLEELEMHYAFARVFRVDRCQTCHVGIDRTDTAELKDLAAQAEDPHRKAILSALAAHPRQDLFVSDGSPHPKDTFGCTICHDGRPIAMDFDRAAHMPSTEEEWERWEELHHWHPDLHGAHWERPMLPSKYVEASCYKCHKQERRIEGAPKLNRGRELFETFGCYGCHKVEGYEEEGRVGPDLEFVASKVTQDWTASWIKEPTAFRPDTTMPSFFGLDNNAHDVPRTDLEILGMTTYLFEASRKHHYAGEMPEGDVKRGAALVERTGCQACHAITGNEVHGPEFGPDLRRVGEKIADPRFLAEWVKNPEHHFVDAQMPSFPRLSDQEASDVAAYLMTLKEEEPLPEPELHADQIRPWIERNWEGKYSPLEIEGKYDELLENEVWKILDRVALDRLDDPLALAVGWIRLKEDRRRTGSPLGKVEIAPGRDPSLPAVRSYRRAVRDPEDRGATWSGEEEEALSLFEPVTDSEPWGGLAMEEGDPIVSGLRDSLTGRSLPAVLAEFRGKWNEEDPAHRPVFFLIDAILRERELLQNAAAALEPQERELMYVGERSLTHYGCAGCHQIPGVPRGQGIGVELSGPQAIGNRDLNKIDFGFIPFKRTLDSFLHHKLKEPRIFDVVFVGKGEEAERVGIREKPPKDLLRMPDFHMTDEEAESVVTFLMGLQKFPIPESYQRRLSPEEQEMEHGKRLLTRANCQVCHVLERDRILLEADIPDPVTQKRTRKTIEVPGEFWTDHEEEMEFFKPLQSVQFDGFDLENGISIPLEELQELDGSDGAPKWKGKKDRIGGDFRETMSAHFIEEEGLDEEELATVAALETFLAAKAPPVLEGEGWKVQTGFLSEFMKEPIPIRPSVEVHMPKFRLTKKEADVLAKYFALVDGAPYPYDGTSESTPDLKGEEIRKTRDFFWDGQEGCVQCHSAEGRRPEGDPADWGPDLSLAHRRLRPAWIVNWLKGPSLMKPGTKMPNFDQPFQDREIDAEGMKDFLMHLHRFQPPENGKN